MSSPTTAVEALLILSTSAERQANEMEQDLFLQREELAQEHHLGELQKDYTIRWGKQIAIWGLVALAVIAFLSLPPHGMANGIVLSLHLFFLVLFTFAGPLLGRQLYKHRWLHVYMYTGGLIYLNRNERKAIRWEQINTMYRDESGRLMKSRGGINIDWDGPREPMLYLTPFIDDIGTLYSTIKREVDNLRSSG